MITIKQNLAQIAHDYLNGWIGLTECYHKTIEDAARWYSEAMGIDTCPPAVTDDALNFVNNIIMGDPVDLNGENVETAE